MANWKTYKITSKDDHITFWLDDDVIYSNRTDLHYIDCVNTYPFSDWQVGDYIEIDLDRLRYYESSRHRFDDNSMIKKVSSLAVISNSFSSTNIITTHGSSSDVVVSPNAVNAMKSPQVREITREMSRLVDETGKNWEYKIEVENKDGKKISHSLICRKN